MTENPTSPRSPRAAAAPRRQRRHGGWRGGWQGAGREITIAVLLVLALTAAAWALDGPAAAGFTAVAARR